MSHVTVTAALMLTTITIACMSLLSMGLEETSTLIVSTPCTPAEKDLKYFLYTLKIDFRECGMRKDCSSIGCAYGDSWTVKGVKVTDR